MPNRRSMLAIACSPLLVAGLTAMPAQASEYWNQYTTDLPAFVTGPTQFTVTVDGPDPVCSMTYNQVQRTTAPWTFTFTPGDSVDSVVQVAECGGSGDSVDVWATRPFSVSNPVLFKGVDEQSSRVTVYSRMDSTATAEIVDDRGVVVARADVAPHSETAIGVPMTRARSTKMYSITITSSDGLRETTPIIAAAGWAPLMAEQGTHGSFATCSTLTWYYSTAGQPQASKTMRKEIASSLARLSKVTGLTFAETTSAADADIVYDWEHMGAHAQSANGGYEWSSSGPSRGSVTFNSDDSWVRDSARGLGVNRRNNMAGRGWLVIHETMHALGFGHVADRTSVMHPVNYGVHTFNKGDLEGLRTLYPRTCTT